ncbi:MAG: hypothetical protein CSA49_07585 [Gammaproteobacteria bacterium]|nr:MAG: hypothetical protein CSA49_07585 [Gammaproteobacteria bacterium]
MINISKSIPDIGHISAQPTHSYISFSQPLSCISNAPWLGGPVCPINGILNLKVAGNHPTGKTPSIEQTITDACRQYQLQGRFVGLITAASMKSFRFRITTIENYTLVCAVTAGIANARRVGDRADDYELGQQPRTVGTINIMFATNVPLSPAAQQEAFALITEAKTAACYDLQILSTQSQKIATGTGTDATVVASAELATPGIDSVIPYCGKHTKLGELIGQMSYQAMADTLQGCLDCLTP